MPSSFARRGLAARFLLAAALSLLLAGSSLAATAPSTKPPPRNAATAVADDLAENGPSPDGIKLGLTAIKTRLDQGNFTPELLSDEMRQVTALRTAAGECQQIATDQLARVGQALAAVGDKQTDETTDLATTRQKIEAYKTQTEGRRAECRLHIVFADSLIEKIDAAQKSLLKERLTRRGASIWDLALWNLQHAQVWSDAGIGAAAGALAFGATDAVGVVLVCLLLAAGIRGGLWLRRRLEPFVAKPPEPSFSMQLAHGIVAATTRDIVLWAPVAGVAVAFIVTDAIAAELTFRTIFAVGLAGFLTARILIRGLLAPNSPARQLIGLDNGLARALLRRLAVVAGTIALGVSLHFAPLEARLPLEANLLARSVYVAILVINLGWLTWLVGLMPRLRNAGRVIRLVLMATLFIILVAEWLGYRSLSSYLLEGLMETSVVAAAFWLLGALAAEAGAGLDGSGGVWSTKLRNRLGLEEEEGFPGLVWMRLLLTLVIWVGAGILLLRAWGLSDSGSALVLGYLVDGIAIGDMQFVPSRVLSGVIVFSVLLGLARWLRNWVETKWLSRSRMDRGAKDAVVTITGYCGFVTAALFGLSSAGFALSNLALIASALSVGIGFGLQNIVSNFVAGLILLFERPIKTGDWVVVGGTEGIVKRIRVRATEIRTFERSDVAVPNSELINAHVKNWTLRDRVGRAVIPIGVAYGSDTELVRRLLLETTSPHPGIVHDTKGDPVKVLFRGFGACSLDFELSFTVRNVDDRGDIISDTNFAIDKAFRAHQVEIPYPQHEVRIRGWSDEVVAMLEGRRTPKAREDGEPVPPPRRGLGAV
jgi:potassium-dependent mechanosensitive channel